MSGMLFKAALAYFALVFGAGFLFGVIRVFFLVPQVGVRTAELIEAPLMLVVTIVSAKWIVSRFHIRSLSYRLLVGLLALLLMLAVEFGLVLRLSGLSLSEYWKQRDPVSGTVHFVMLAVFGLMPVLVGRTYPPTTAAQN